MIPAATFTDPYEQVDVWGALLVDVDAGNVYNVDGRAYLDLGADEEPGDVTQLIGEMSRLGYVARTGACGYRLTDAGEQLADWACS